MLVTLTAGGLSPLSGDQQFLGRLPRANGQEPIPDRGARLGIVAGMSDAPQISVRPATTEDIAVLSDLYRLLEAEMIALEEMWPLADGLPEPVDEALEAEIANEDSVFLVGLVDGYPFGFLIARVEGLLPQASGERIGAIRYVFVDQGVRQVSVGEHMLEVALAELRDRGIERFDAHVLPGHRLVKNFFESGGFSARSIVMHNDGE